MALVLSKDRQRVIADHLGLHPQELVFSALYSEEAQVYRISRQDREIVAWLKVHSQPAKARRETQVLGEWGRVLNGPKVITVIEERVLLLSHCRGESVHGKGGRNDGGREISSREGAISVLLRRPPALGRSVRHSSRLQRRQHCVI